MSQRYQGGFITASYNGLKVPDAPTIGTATAGNTSASVTFTAPSNVGGGAITGYTVVSSPGGFTGTGASSPITVSGLTNGASYTFTVVATNAYGTGPASAASNSIIPALQVGDAYEGGFYAGQISTTANGVATHNLVIAPKSTGQSFLKWQTTPSDTAGTSSFIDGPTNSANMNSAGYPAAQFCEGLSIGGYTDWYLPAENELEVCYYFLKKDTTANSTSSGSNANAVAPEPISTNYSAGSPTQTPSAAFKIGGAETFESYYYWSSTQSSAGQAWLQIVTDGAQFASSKTDVWYVRAVRRIPV